MPGPAGLGLAVAARAHSRGIKWPINPPTTSRRSLTPPESNFGNKKVVNFRGFGVPTARPEGAKGRTGLGWVWNGHFRPPWGWLLGDFFVP